MLLCLFVSRHFRVCVPKARPSLTGSRHRDHPEVTSDACAAPSQVLLAPGQPWGVPPAPLARGQHLKLFPPVWPWVPKDPSASAHYTAEGEPLANGTCQPKYKFSLPPPHLSSGPFDSFLGRHSGRQQSVTSHTEGLQPRTESALWEGKVRHGEYSQ